MSRHVFKNLSELKGLVGRPLGTSDWILLDQHRIDMFADATGDQQWIHVDRRRAAKGPFGAPIAHGFLTLSLVPVFLETAFHIGDSALTVNYGLNRVRFTSPVPVGSRLRGHFKLLGYETIDGGAQLTMEGTVEREGAAKPACVLESVMRRYLPPIKT